jgi:hypothetical protein
MLVSISDGDALEGLLEAILFNAGLDILTTMNWQSETDCHRERSFGGVRSDRLVGHVIENES